MVLTRDQEGIRTRDQHSQLGAMVQVGLEMRKFRTSQDQAKDEDTVGSNLTLELEIRNKLGWCSADQSFSYPLSTLLERISQAGIKDPNSYLTIPQAAKCTGLSERTLWKHMAQGKLVRCDSGSTASQAEVYVPSLFRIVLETERLVDQPLSSSETLGREVVTLCHVIAEQQKTSVRMTDELLEIFREQRGSFEDLREEQQESFHQMYKQSQKVIELLEIKRKRSPFKSIFHLSI